MKLITINTHSLVEEHYSEKLDTFVSAIAEIQPEIIALQEVNQTASESEISEAESEGLVKVGVVPVKRDNHVYNAVKMLREMGVNYYWTWLGMKLGYDKYDEGIALMSRSPILEAKVITISKIDDYGNWKTRKIVGVRTEAHPKEWFVSVHLGWWNDETEPFQNQWKRTLESLPDSGNIWLMGDFNSPAEVRSEGYDMMLKDGFCDSFTLAENRDSGVTVGKVIDGWREKINSTDGMRIDLILSREKRNVRSSQVIFGGENKAVISDHYGVLIEVKE